MLKLKKYALFLEATWSVCYEYPRQPDVYEDKSKKEFHVFEARSLREARKRADELSNAFNKLLLQGVADQSSVKTSCWLMHVLQS